MVAEHRVRIVWTLLVSAIWAAAEAAERDYPIQPVPSMDVRLTAAFSAPRTETNRKVAVPYVFGKCEETSWIDTFAVAGGPMEGEHRGDFPMAIDHLFRGRSRSSGKVWLNDVQREERKAASGTLERPEMYYADESYGRPFAKDPDVEWFQGRYLLYYSMRREGGFAVGIAESHDLTNWRKVGEVLPGADYENKGLAAPAALVRSGKLHLFYQSYGNGPRDAICHAVSTDGIHFTRNPTNPIFRPTGPWNCGRAIDAEVIETDGQLLLYCATRDPGMKVQKVLVAAAPANSAYDRTDWKQICDAAILEPELPWEKRCIEAPALCKRGDRLYMFYAGGYNNEPQQIGCAMSEDGISWQRLSQRPLLPNGAPGEWNASESGHPGVFTDRDGSMYLFFQGNRDDGASWHISKMRIAWDDADLPYLIRPRDGRMFRLR
jgi:predicted GH43/DUF377 family glycosyl hydrolase